jgi:hypothetical protein
MGKPLTLQICAKIVYVVHKYHRGIGRKEHFLCELAIYAPMIYTARA